MCGAMSRCLATVCTLALALAPVFRTASAQPREENWDMRRERMVREQIESRGVRDPRVLEAMRAVRRERFVPSDVRELSDLDTPLPIGWEQTISQPYIVAYMTELLEIERDHSVLEIGTGSGYQTAVLATLCDRVHSVELVPELAARAAETLRELGYEAVRVRQGDGYLGWPVHAPYDRIMVTAAPPEIPQALVDQLAPGGRLVVPVGRTSETQRLVLVTADEDGRVRRQNRLGVRFVPMVSPPRVD